MDKIRIGILGAARIAPKAVVFPTTLVEEAEIVAVAARDMKRAETFAKEHHIAQSYDSYEAILKAKDIDAIYNPLPNSLHAPYTIKALEAGKHVLSEKPFASNAQEGENMLQVAKKSSKVLMNAYHYRYHPLMDHILKVMTSGKLGAIRHVTSFFTVPNPNNDNIRFQYELAGGTVMDLGCYAIHIQRHIMGMEPTVRGAKANLLSPNIDLDMQIDMEFPNGVTGMVHCSMDPKTNMACGLKVYGNKGELTVGNPFAPHDDRMEHKVVLESQEGTVEERITGDTTYTYQMRHFAKAILENGSVITDAEDGIHNMRVIDAAYVAAGLSVRGV